MFDDDASNAVVDWLERLSAKEGYAEAAQLRRDLLAAHGEDGTWDTLSPDVVATGLSAWLGATRYGGVTLPALPGDALAAAAREIQAALGAHQSGGNAPATLSVEQFGDGIQALWTALRGPDDPDPEPEQGGPTPNMNISLTGGRS